MATTVDNLTMKVTVDGSASLDDLSNKLGNVDKNTKATSESLKQFNIRNVAYQVQDLAVQLSMGTNAFIALGQQLPQLLSGFGVAGAVIGAVAAVAIPLLQKGLETLGYDFRNLNQRISDLSNSTKEYISAQQSNLASLEGLQASYGKLSATAKEFFEIQEQIRKQKAFVDLRDAVRELQSDFKDLLPNYQAFRDGLGALSGPVEGVARLQSAFQRWRLDVTAEQAQELSKRIRALDPTNTEKFTKQITELTQYLKESGIEVGKNKKLFDELINPLLLINEKILEQQKNIKASGEEASKLSAELLGIQSKYQPDINAARRNFDQITAIRLEGIQKIAEFERQANERTSKDGVNREAELRAFRLRTNQEVNDRVADFVKSQNEAYRTSVLQNNTKKDQLTLQEQLLRLSEEGRLSAFNTYQLEQDLLQNAYNYAEALKAISEQRRKNIIDAAQAAKLEKDAAAIREQADQQSYTAAERRQRTFLETQNQLINQDRRRIALTAETASLSDREKKNAEAIFNINEERQKQLLGLQQLNDPILRVVKEKEINAVYDQRIESLKKVQEADKAVQENFTAGWSNALANYVEESQNAFKRASTLFSSVTKGMEDMLVGFFKTGRLGWKEFTASIVEELLRSQIRQLIARTFSGLNLAGAAAGSGGLFGGAIIPGFLAMGGTAASGKPYIVGERGPELFVPNSSGTIVPNNQLIQSKNFAGAGASVVYNINAVDAPSFKAMIARDPAFIYSVSQMGAKTVPGRI